MSLRIRYTKIKNGSGGYRENDPLDGFDPYSNSKSCSELVTHSYRKSFLDEKGIAVSTARAGNVIGGGDFSRDRIIPDCVRSALQGEEIIIRNPYSIRPFQHVLEPLAAYMQIAAAQAMEHEKAGYYNVGIGRSRLCHCRRACRFILQGMEYDLKWKNVCEEGHMRQNF